MKENKFGKILDNVFAWGIYAALVLGGLAFFGFLVALVIGGGADSFSQSLAAFIQKKYFPVVIRLSAITIGIGLISMYVNKVTALSIKSEKKDAEEELNALKEQK